MSNPTDFPDGVTAPSVVSNAGSFTTLTVNGTLFSGGSGGTVSNASTAAPGVVKISPSVTVGSGGTVTIGAIAQLDTISAGNVSGLGAAAVENIGTVTGSVADGGVVFAQGATIAAQGTSLASLGTLVAAKVGATGGTLTAGVLAGGSMTGTVANSGTLLGGHADGLAIGVTTPAVGNFTTLGQNGTLLGGAAFAALGTVTGSVADGGVVFAQGTTIAAQGTSLASLGTLVAAKVAATGGTLTAGVLAGGTLTGTVVNAGTLSGGSMVGNSGSFAALTVAGTLFTGGSGGTVSNASTAAPGVVKISPSVTVGSGGTVTIGAIAQLDTISAGNVSGLGAAAVENIGTVTGSVADGGVVFAQGATIAAQGTSLASLGTLVVAKVAATGGTLTAGVLAGGSMTGTVANSGTLLGGHADGLAIGVTTPAVGNFTTLEQNGTLLGGAAFAALGTVTGSVADGGVVFAQGTTIAAQGTSLASLGTLVAAKVAATGGTLTAGVLAGGTLTGTVVNAGTLSGGSMVGNSGSFAALTVAGTLFTGGSGGTVSNASTAAPGVVKISPSVTVGSGGTVTIGAIAQLDTISASNVSGLVASAGGTLTGGALAGGSLTGTLASSGTLLGGHADSLVIGATIPASGTFTGLQAASGSIPGVDVGSSLIECIGAVTKINIQTWLGNRLPLKMFQPSSGIDQSDLSYALAAAITEANGMIAAGYGQARIEIPDGLTNIKGGYNSGAPMPEITQPCTVAGSGRGTSAIYILPSVNVGAGLFTCVGNQNWSSELVPTSTLLTPHTWLTFKDFALLGSPSTTVIQDGICLTSYWRFFAFDDLHFDNLIGHPIIAGMIPSGYGSGSSYNITAAGFHEGRFRYIRTHLCGTGVLTGSGVVGETILVGCTNEQTDELRFDHIDLYGCYGSALKLRSIGSGGNISSVRGSAVRAEGREVTSGGGTGYWIGDLVTLGVSSDVGGIASMRFAECLLLNGYAGYSHLVTNVSSTYVSGVISTGGAGTGVTVQSGQLTEIDLSGWGSGSGTNVVISGGKEVTINRHGNAISVNNSGAPNAIITWVGEPGGAPGTNAGVAPGNVVQMGVTGAAGGTPAFQLSLTAQASGNTIWTFSTSTSGVSVGMTVGLPGANPQPSATVVTAVNPGAKQITVAGTTPSVTSFPQTIDFYNNVGNVPSEIIYDDGGSPLWVSRTVNRATGVQTFGATPQFPTATSGDNSTNGATTAFVANAISGATGGASVSSIAAGGTISSASGVAEFPGTLGGTVYLPLISTARPGAPFVVKDIGGAAAGHNIFVSVNPGDTGTIDSGSTIAANFGALTLETDGTNWHITDSYVLGNTPGGAALLNASSQVVASGGAVFSSLAAGAVFIGAGGTISSTTSLTGLTLDNTPIGSTTPSTVKATSLTVTAGATFSALGAGIVQANSAGVLSSSSTLNNGTIATSTLNNCTLSGTTGAIPGTLNLTGAITGTGTVAATFIGPTGTIAAAGTSLATATTFTPGAASVNTGTGGVRPVSAYPVGGWSFLTNDTSSAWEIYPDVAGSVINALTAGTGRSVPSGSSALLVKIAAGSFTVGLLS